MGLQSTTKWTPVILQSLKQKKKVWDDKGYDKDI